MTLFVATIVEGETEERCIKNSPSFDKLCRELALRLQPSESPPTAETESGQAPPSP